MQTSLLQPKVSGKFIRSLKENITSDANIKTRRIYQLSFSKIYHGIHHNIFNNLYKYVGCEGAGRGRTQVSL